MIDTGDERVCLEARRHGVVLLRPLLRSLAAAGLGVAGVAAGWPASVAGAVLLVGAAAGAVAAVWRWDRTHLVLTTEKLFVVHGVVRRHAAAVRLARIGAIELEQSLAGRILGYGTIVAGELEIRCVADPREVVGAMQRLMPS
jgi:uncharacterized membrane protein YdbT with pleckstrin-like domain